MSRDAGLYLADIAEAAAKVQAWTDGVDRAAFLSDARSFDAKLRNLEIIGEAAKHVPPELVVAAPEVPWRQIIRLRDRLAHAYFRVDPAIVWDIVENELGPLAAAVERLRSSSPQ